MLNVRAHRTLAAVLRFLRVAQRRVSLRSLVGEVFGVRRSFNDRCFLSPVRTVAIDRPLRTVQEIGQHLRVVHGGRCAHRTVDESALCISANVQLHAEVPLLTVTGLMHLRGAEPGRGNRRCLL